MYYLQSRYYDPQICRFINADAFVSTGQGVLGNNMFAYCNNNPVRFSDLTGRNLHNAIIAVCKDGPGDPFRNQRLNTGSPSEFAREMDTLISGFVGINGIQGYVDSYNILMSYDPVQNISAIDQMASGWDMIKEGAALYALPAPTLLDELVGMGKILWGFGEVVQGFVELIDEDWW